MRWNAGPIRRVTRHEAVLDAAGATLLDIEAGAGWLIIEGKDDLAEVRIVGTACASRRSLLDAVKLETERRGDRLIVVAGVDYWRHMFSWHRTARLDLTLEVPSDLALRIEDGSGRVEIVGVASIALRDGSGEIRLEQVAGDVRVRDGSGSLSILEIEGGLTIVSDGSGEIDIAAVRGDVEIGSDGSGGITIRDVTGHVLIGRDGSGSIRIAGIGGDVTVRHDGSGSIRVKDVKGKIDVPN